MRVRIRPFAACLAILIGLSGCAVNPVTGRQELSLISPQQEIMLGQQNYGPNQQAQGGPYELDRALQNYVSEVGHSLARHSHQPDLPYEFVVLNNSVPNAWAMPGGKIAINRGLLTLLDNEAELAAVLGHEIVHAAARHSAQQMSRGQLMGMGVQVLGALGQQSGYGQLAGSVAELGAGAWMARYSRSDELESDHYGMEYMVKAGYNPMGAVTLQEKFVALSQGRQAGALDALFASHPPSQERVNANRALAQQLGTSGTLNEQRYQQRIARLKRTEPAYKAQDEAIEALNNKNPKAALAALDKAIDIEPDESHFWELRGHAWQMQNDPTRAEQAFTTAIRKNPNYFRHHLARGLLRQQIGNREGAVADLQASFELLPTDLAAQQLQQLGVNVR